MEERVYQFGMEFFCHLRTLVGDNYVIPLRQTLERAMKLAIGGGDILATSGGGISEDISDRLTFVDGRTGFVCLELPDMIAAAQRSLIIETLWGPPREGYKFLASDWTARGTLRTSGGIGYNEDMRHFVSRVLEYCNHPHTNPNFVVNT